MYSEWIFRNGTHPYNPYREQETTLPAPREPPSLPPPTSMNISQYIQSTVNGRSPGFNIKLYRCSEQLVKTIYAWQLDGSSLSDIWNKLQFFPFESQ